MAGDMTNRANDLADALGRIVQWADAYPPDIFPPPDADYLKHAAEVLAANGMSLDRLSASAMRHVVEGVGEIAREALKMQESAHARPD